MNKKLMAVAVAGALAAPALAYAQASTVQIFGRLNFIYGYYDNGGGGTTTAGGAVVGTPKVRTDSMSDSEAQIGFRGEENVGGGMAVHFQCLTSFDITGARANAGTSQWCGRDSNVGLKGNFGNVFIGNYDVAQKMVISKYRVFPLNAPIGLGNTFNGSASNVNNVAAGGLGAVDADLSSFSRRQMRSVHYWSPVISGFQGMATYSAANEGTLSTSASTIQKPRMASVGVNYSNGPFGIALAYERHRDYNPAGQATYTGGTDSSWQLGMGYKFMGKLQLNLQYAHLEYDLAGGRDMAQNNWNVNGQWDIAGPHRIRVGYVKTGHTKGSAGTAAAPIQVGQMVANGGVGDSGSNKFIFEYAYEMSKRTELSAAYAKVNNDRFSNKGVGTGADGNNFGESQTYIGGRISHRF